LARLGVVLFCLTGCDDGAAEPAAPASLRISNAPLEPATGEAVVLSVEVVDTDGAAVEVPIVATVERGGGDVAIEGGAVTWTLGELPVLNLLRVAVEDEAIEQLVTLTPSLPAPLEDEVFGDVEAFLESEAVSGSTEDLAFVGDAMVLGVPGGLLSVAPDGSASRIPLTGDAMGESVLGVAVDTSGALWVADAGAGALRKIVEGEVSTALDGLVAPNYVAVGPGGHIFVTDPCAGELLRYDPGAGEVVARHAFDLPTEGGPNGVAFDDDGRLWGVTENTALLCNHADTVEATAPIAQLFVLDVAADGFGERERVLDNIGLFGDGVAFDLEGNLYFIADTTEGFMLEESAVWVLPAGGQEATRLLVADEKAIFANLAFGTEPFGATTLYISMLAIAPFADERGVRRAELGVAGRPLLP